MLMRIGNAVYRFGCGVAALIVAVSIYMYLETEFEEDQSDNLIVAGGFVVAAFIAWLTGLICRYILSEE